MTERHSLNDPPLQMPLPRPDRATSERLPRSGSEASTAPGPRPLSSAGPGSGEVPQVRSFEKVYEDSFDFVWRSARRLGVSTDAIEDLVQEVYVIVHRQLCGFEGRSTLKTWLYGIVLRVVREQRRRDCRANARRRSNRDDGEPERDERALPDEQLAQAQAARMLEGILNEMPIERREVFVMTELEQMTIPEVAAVTGARENTVYSRLRLAREDFERSVARRRARDGWKLR